MKTVDDFLKKVNGAILEYSREMGERPNYLILGKREIEFFYQDDVMDRLGKDLENITAAGNIEKLWSLQICRSTKESMVMVVGEME